MYWYNPGGRDEDEATIVSGSMARAGLDLFARGGIARLLRSRWWREGKERRQFSAQPETGDAFDPDRLSFRDDIRSRAVSGFCFADQRLTRGDGDNHAERAVQIPAHKC